ncbi:MAG: cobalamin B12-binding domain-containing protein [Nitrospinae bacterium]|nr:cobalamin B12-binding domain-containing protein [Nitrospinota bacterium]
MPDALIVIPRVDKRHSTPGIVALSSILPVIGVEYIKLYAREKGKREIRVFYEDLEEKETIYELIDKAGGETVIGVHITSLSYENSVRIMEYAHARGLRVVVGGPHAQISWKLILQYRPYAICVPSYGEVAMLALIEGKPLSDVPGIIYLENGAIHKNPAEPVNYEELPLINGLIDHEPFFRKWQGAKKIYKQNDSRGYVSVRGIKGCAKPKPCTFCTVERMETYDPVKRAERISAERFDATARFGGNIFIRECNDDLPNRECLLALKALTPADYKTPIYNNARINELLRDGLPELVRGAGYTDLLLGLESLSEPGLKYTGKSLNSLRDLHRLLKKTESTGLNFYISCIMGWPGETRETYSQIERNIEALLEYKHVVSVGLGFLILYPYTHLFNLLMDDPVYGRKHFGRPDADILDYFGLFSDWLNKFANGLSYDFLDDFMQNMTARHKQVIYLSGFAV